MYEEYALLLAAGGELSDAKGKAEAVKASRKAAALARKRGASPQKAGMIAAAVYKKVLRDNT